MHPATVKYKHELRKRIFDEADRYLTDEELLTILARRMPQELPDTVSNSFDTVAEFLLDWAAQLPGRD